MIFNVRILPLTIAMAFLMLGVKMVDIVRGGEELSARLLVSPVEAQSEAEPEKTAEATPAEGEKKAEEKPAETPPADAAAEKPAEEAKPEEEKKAEEPKAEEKKSEEKKAEAQPAAEHGPHNPKSDEEYEIDPLTGQPASSKPKTITSKRPLGADDRRFTPAELDLLQNLAKRRAELDKWEANVQLKENLLSATEMRVNEKLEQLEALKQELTGMLDQYHKQEDGKIGSLVKIYENMKPRDAARIFEEMDMPILLEVVDRMAEKRAAPILAGMDPLKAKQLTQELAEYRRVAGSKVKAAENATQAPAEAPKP